VNGRAVVTGIGIVAANGIGTDEYWRAALAGQSGLRTIDRFDPSAYPTQVAGQIPDFEPKDHVDQRVIPQTDRFTWIALTAAQMALKDADLDPVEHEPYAMSVITASASGGNEFGQREIQELWSKGPGAVTAYQSIAWFYAASTGQISIKHGMKGPCSVLVSEGAGGLDALGHARRTIRRGSDFVLCGGAEAPLGPYALAAQMPSARLSHVKTPEDAYRPFDERADGYVPGEGGAVLLVEDEDYALARGAPHVYGEIAGYAATHDAYHYALPAPDGRQYARAMRLAIADAGLEPGDIGAIFADAVGVPEDDAIEVGAIKQTFGADAVKIPVTAPKSMVGRLYSGGAALDVATALLSLRDKRLPPTIGLEQPQEGFDLDFVIGGARELDASAILVAARGYGGFNSAMVVKEYREGG
jgi:minimal PKS chain-length factor (CLF/KS beta)